MVGCCGQPSNNQNVQKRDKCAPINTNISNKCMPGEGRVKGKSSGQHDEEICHGTGERRRDLLDQLKIFLNEFDDTPCKVTPPQTGPDAVRTLGSYDEYLKKHCQSWMPPNPRPPLITSVQTHEIRATSDYDKMKGETSEFISFTDATLKIPTFTCDCVKRNGLQDQCPHPMCKPPTAQCKANNPGPCCPPSLGLGGPEAVLGGSKGKAEASGGKNQGPQGPRSEYQDAYAYCSSSCNQQTPPQTPPNPYTTTYRQDFHGQQQHQQQPQQCQQAQQPVGPGLPKPPPGMEMVCICKVPSSALQSGKKYLCCPIMKQTPNPQQYERHFPPNC